MTSSERACFEGLVGRSVGMKDLCEWIAVMALHDEPVLIRGERGTEKTAVAAAVHRLSGRRKQELHVIQCGMYAGGQWFYELIGSVRDEGGTASGSSVGLFAQADGATLVLEDVDELPEQAQALLVRLIEHGDVRPLGSVERQKVDLRIVATTSVDLEAAVERGSFRESLYYLLHHAPVEIPPLRARREDIPVLVEAFRVAYGCRHGRSVRGVTAEALAALSAQPWPGNLGELHAVLAEPMLLCPDDGWIGVEDLACWVRGPETPAAPRNPGRRPLRPRRRPGH